MQNAEDKLKVKLAERDANVLAKQVSEWTAEMRRLSDLIAAAKGTSCALVMISGTDEDYADVAPQLVLEDALRVSSYGWPQGFEIDLLNSSD